MIVKEALGVLEALEKNKKMNIIIPMAGRGTRLRPHTLTTPKPLIKIAGKTIVQRLVEEISSSFEEAIDNIGFVVGDFGSEVEESLIKIAESLGAAGHIFYQARPLGTAHAVLCAEKIMNGSCVIAFADTLFKSDFNIKKSVDGTIWVKKIDDPSSFGVVKTDKDIVTDFIEKPDVFVSDLAIIGIYHVKEASILKREIKFLIDNKIKDKGEYQLTNVLENMKNKNYKFGAAEVKEWLDCGNKGATCYTNQRVLHHQKNKLDQTSQIINCEIIEPCYIGKNNFIKDSKIGPHVSIEDNNKIEACELNNVILQSNNDISKINLNNSMIGSFTLIKGKHTHNQVSIGDYTIIE